jgi:transposase-like protein
MFIPPFCPNKACPYHNPKLCASKWFWNNGTYNTKCFNTVQRFKCRHCSKEFSTQTFHLDYYAKKQCDYEIIYNHVISSAGVRDIARALEVRTDVIQNRIGRLSRQCMAIHTEILSTCTLTEDLVADGFESFCYSQYFPNNIHLLVGNESRVLYFLNGVTIRRKGRMTIGQKKRREALEEVWQVEKGGVRKSFKELLFQMKELYDGSEKKKLTLYTDEKYDYVQAFGTCKKLQKLLDSGEWTHDRTNSRVARTTKNPLFAVNYMDREIRKGLSNHHRETVQWSKDMSEMFKRLIIYGVNHNVKMPYDVKHENQDDRVHWEVAGVSKGTLNKACDGIFTKRRFFSHCELSGFLEKVWLSKVRTPLDLRGGYHPKYLRM